MSFELQKVRWDRRSQIRRGDPIRECGLDFFPITMDRYDDFIMCKDALGLRLSSLPVRYVSMDYLSDVFALEMESADREKAKMPPGMFFRIIRLLGLSLRMEIPAGFMKENVIYGIKETPGARSLFVKSIILRQKDAEGRDREASITPFQFSSQIRPLIAAQNQIPLPDESENSDLVDAYEMKKQIQHKGPPLNTDLDALVSSVAYQSGVPDREIMTWNVRDFENRRRAIERDKRYSLYTQAELTGTVTFKNGNPYSSWCFDAVDDTLGTMEYAELAKTLSGAAAPGSGPV